MTFALLVPHKHDIDLNKLQIGYLICMV